MTEEDRKREQAADLKGALSVNQPDIDYMENRYHTKEVSRNLGFTRETLRYYEELGLIRPQRGENGQYREFDFFDISRLMAIDFYKKRGFSPLEIKKLMQLPDTESYSVSMKQQTEALQNTILSLQEMLERLREAQIFLDNNDGQMGSFSVKNMPRYCVRETLDAVSHFEEYQDKVLRHLNLEREDVLSNMVRKVVFDENGYKGSEICLVKPAQEDCPDGDRSLLETGRCLYTAFAADNQDNSVMKSMFILCHEWAAEHGETFRGVAYIFIRGIFLREETDRNYYEVWIPLQ